MSKTQNQNTQQHSGPSAKSGASRFRQTYASLAPENTLKHLLGNTYIFIINVKNTKSKYTAAFRPISKIRRIPVQTNICFPCPGKHPKTLTRQYVHFYY